uniref:Uncharacterized protein n=2 Tax=Meloidogyne TaxID=189290 RepID=A0A6V7XSY2_MELEN|nr:unnamed protein product [Meloidogyne enterolobii]
MATNDSEGEVCVTEQQPKKSINLNETEDSLWRYFGRPSSTLQTKIKCLLCKKLIPWNRSINIRIAKTFKSMSPRELQGVQKGS